LAEAALIDRRRLALVLQAAGLLAILERAGWRIPDWAAARALPDGRLTVTGAEPGRPPQAQEVLCALLGRLFGLDGGGRLAGKGLARVAARALLESWRPSLVPLAPDDAVGQILDAAPFLWEPSDAAVRGALAGELILAEEGRERPVLCAAGPPAFRRRVLAGASGLAELHGRLTGSEARGLWDGAGEEGDPQELTAARRWRAAVAAWSRHPPRSEADGVAFARSLAALGRFETSLAALSGLSSSAARILRADCQAWMGQLAAALVTLDGLREVRLSAEESVELAEIASRVGANRGGERRIRIWVRRLLAAAEEGGPYTVLRARLAAAFIAWDDRDLPAMARALDQSGLGVRAATDPDLAWRWHHARAHLAMDRDGDGAAAVEHVARALRLARRHLPRHRAGGLWNDLGLGRALAGDLAGAERAFLCSHRLIAGCDGPRKVTLALFNLAEIRLRRGRLAGVREILERSTAENRAAGNLRGLTQDAELLARWELVAGRPEAALALCRSTLEDLERQKRAWRREVLLLLAARALGWLGRAAEAAATLDGLPATALYELEPEERPALQALAGRRDEARRAAAALAPDLRALWEALLEVLPEEGGPAMPPLSLWQAGLASLEPWRAARLVFDAERLAPGSAPGEVLRTAAACLRAAGTVAMAEALEARDQGPWQALAAYCACEPGDPAALAALFAGAGCPEAALLCLDGSGERIVVAGPGGGEAGEEIWHPLPDGGRVTLRARRADVMLRALLALAARDLAAPPAFSLPVMPLAGPVPRPLSGTGGAGSMVGESPELREALGRLDLLAAGGLPILILGESGTGKELAARRAHRMSPRARAPFLAVNCAALSETLILSDLFGHAKGAFTGADRDRAGVFQAASGGTVFLDEIGDLPLTAQALLLRVIQEGEVRRLGESEPKRVDVRVLAATHRDLAAMVQAKTFRQDLYYRLKVGLVELPPLRDRGGDLLLLAETILARMDRFPAPRLSKEARAGLLAYPWPGNVRELENVLRVAAALAGNDPIQPEHLDLPAVEKPSAPFYHHAMEAVRRQEIESALAACNGNRTRAAQRLGMSRQGLSYWMRRLGIG
jgi:transcriptional regulator with AAA-type ATPase domain